MTFYMTAVTDTFTCVSLFRARRTNFSRSHWQTEKQGYLTGNTCHLHLLPQEAFKIKEVNRTSKRYCRCVDNVNVGIYNVLLTVKLFCCFKINGFWFMLVCFAFVFCHVLTFVRYIGVYYRFGIVLRRISLNRISLYRGSVPYILL